MSCLKAIYSDSLLCQSHQGNDGNRRLERTYCLDVPSETAGTGPPALAGLNEEPPDLRVKVIRDPPEVIALISCDASRSEILLAVRFDHAGFTGLRR